MKTKLLFTVFIFILSCAFMHGEEVSKEKASRVAKSFYYEHSNISYDAIYFDEEITIESDGITVYYIFNLPSDFGFVIVSAENHALPVLGYSLECRYIHTEQPPNFKNWMKGYEDQILYIKANNLPSTDKIDETWQMYGSNIKKQKNGNRSIVGPLLGNIIWNQNCYYNDSCPSDPAGPCGHVYAGCVATGTGMVMKYHHHPHQGTGSHSYVHPSYGTLSANFGATTYDWANMLEISSNEYIAQLLYHIGVSVDMNYGPSGSGAYTSQAVSSLVTYFNYDPIAFYDVKSNYSDPVWESMVITELDADRPLPYRGQGTGGHSFVCDGYDDNYQGTGNVYFHFNWGWSGSFNGYYHLTALNPGSANFTTDQAAGFNIQPRTDVVPYSDFNADANTACVGNTVNFFDQSTNGPNGWNWTFQGGSPATSTNENPSITYNTVGKYDVTLIASNVTGAGSTNTKTGYIRVCDSPATPSCIPYTYNVANNGWGIINVTLNDLDHTTGDTYADGGCLDLTCQYSAGLMPGNSYTLEITVGVGNTGSAHTYVYIDFNNDGDFDDSGETIVNNQISSANNSWNTFTQAVTMPTDPFVNRLLRMRVMTDFNTLYGPCSNPYYGQAEDYGVFFESPPAAPVALAASNVTQISFDANWNASGGADGYYLDVAYDSLFSSFVSGYNNLDVWDVTTYNVSGLSSGTDYFYRVRAYNTYGTSGNSDTISVATLPYPPAAPVAHPAINISQTSFDANWDPSAGADAYILFVAQDSLFSFMVYGYDSLDVGDDTIYNVSGLFVNTDYYYRVRAYNTGGISGNSDTIEVTTHPYPPNIPYAMGATNIQQYSFDANWMSSYGADGYYLDVAVDSVFLNILASYDNLNVGNVTTYNVSGLNSDTKYFYRVRAYNNGGTSGNSNIITVNTLPLAPPPPNALAATNISQNFFDANWNSSPSADGYYLDVAEDSNFTAYVSGFENLNVNDDTTYTVYSLNANTTYYYRVRAYNTGGTSGNSNVIDVTTLPYDPNAPIALPATNIDQTSFDANWNSVPNSIAYYLDVATDMSFTGFVPGYQNLNVGLDTTYHVEGLEPLAEYYYRVRAENIAGTSNNSNIIFVTTLPYPPEPPVATEATNITFFGFDANWNASANADEYLLDVAEDEGFTMFVSGYENLNVWNFTSYSVYGLEENTTYYYRIRAINIIDTSDYSNVISATTLLIGMPDGPAGKEINIYTNNDNIFIYIPDPGNADGYVIVYTLMGQQLVNKSIESSTINRIALPVTNTPVIVKLVLNGNIYIKKLFVGGID
jgi:phosphodiesterase/alkaline phosphatase D-like protein